MRVATGLFSCSCRPGGSVVFASPSVPNGHDARRLAVAGPEPQVVHLLRFRRRGEQHHAPSGNGTGVMLTITDSTGKVVGQLFAPDGQSVSMTLTLPAGSYTMSAMAYRSDGKPIGPVN